MKAEDLTPRSFSWLILTPDRLDIAASTSHERTILGHSFSADGKILVGGRHELTNNHDAWFNIGKENSDQNDFPFKRKLLVIPSLSNPRVFIPDDKPQFKQVSADLFLGYSAKAKLARVLIKYGLLGRPATLYLKEQPALEVKLAALFNRAEVRLAIASGTDGVYRKITAQVIDYSSLEVLGYVKMAAEQESRKTIEKEICNLKMLSSYEDLSINIPKIIYDTLAQKEKSPWFLATAGPKFFSGKLWTRQHEEFIRKVFHNTHISAKLPETRFWTDISANLQLLNSTCLRGWPERLTKLRENIENNVKDVSLPWCLAHRDFSPWNIKTDVDGNLFVFDWESAEKAYPLLYDKIHFLVYTNIVLGKISFAKAVALLKRECSITLQETYPSEDTILVPLIMMYLLDHSLYYLKAIAINPHIGDYSTINKMGAFADYILNEEK